MQLSVNYDQNQNSLPSGFVSAINYVTGYFDSLFTTNATITINVGYGEINGSQLQPNALGESQSYIGPETYSSVKSALTAQGAPGSSTLPTNSPLSGTLYTSQAQAKALGLYSSSSVDGYVGFDSMPNTFSYGINSSPPSNEYYFVGVIEHEFTEIMGRVSSIGDQPNDYSVMDVFRYLSAGRRDTAAGSPGSRSTAYFSIDNGNSNLGTWNNDPNNGDFGDWYPSGPAPGGYDAFNDYSSPGVINQMASSDLTLMEAIGWGAANTSFPGANLGTISASLLSQGNIESNGTTDLVWRDSNAQTTVWGVNTSGAVAVTNLGPIGTPWTVLGSGHYVSNSSGQLLMDLTSTGEMTLWWVNNGALNGIDIGPYWQNISYVASGTFVANGTDDFLVKNNIDNHMYVWWVNSTNDTLQGIDLGPYWANISFEASGDFLSNGSDDMLVKNNIDNHMYVWWVSSSSNTLQGIDIGPYWSNISLQATGNFFGNGSDDMLVKNNIDNHMYVWSVNSSSGTLQGIDLGVYWANINLLASGHFAGTQNEMLVQNAIDTHIYMWWVNAQGSLSGVDLGAFSPQWQVVSTGDYNKDGYTDVVWQNSVTGQVKLWLMGSYSGPTNGNATLGNADTITGASGGQTLFATENSRSVNGGQGQGSNETISAGDGQTVSIVGNPNSILGGGAAGSSLYVAGNYDTITGGAGIGTTLNIDGSNDSITSGVGADTITLGGSNDTVTAGSANMVINMNGADETFQDAASIYADTVVGFGQAAGDRIHLANDTVPDALAHSTQINGSDTLIALSNHSTILLKGVTHIDSNFFS